MHPNPGIFVVTHHHGGATFHLDYEGSQTVYRFISFNDEVQEIQEDSPKPVKKHARSFVGYLLTNNEQMKEMKEKF